MVNRMKRVIPKVGVATLVGSMLIAQALPVFAAGSNYSTNITGEKTTTFDKYLVMKKNANVPNAKFVYAVTAGAAKSYDVDGQKFEVLAGVDADKVTMAGVDTTDANTIAYASGDAVLEDENALVKNYDNTTQKYAKKTATLDFSACAFTEPGVYRYVVTESGTNQGIVNDEDATRIVDVYVYDNTSTADSKDLQIAGYVLHSNVDDEPEINMGDSNGSTGAYVDTKSQGFTNVYDTKDLTFRKEVSGNQASKDKYFEFTLKIEGAVPGTEYDVDLTNADATSGSNAATIEANEGKTNPTKLTADDQGKVEQKFYLQHGQMIKVNGMPVDTQYDLTENAEDYKSTPAGVTSYTDAVNGSISDNDVKTSYLNTRDGVIPTGIFMSVLPGAVVVLLAGAGIATMVMKKKPE